VLCSATFYEFNDIQELSTTTITITEANNSTITYVSTTLGEGGWQSNSWTYVSVTNSTNSVGYVVSSTMIDSKNNLLSTPTLVMTCTYVP
jgi:hypothetical protein